LVVNFWATWCKPCIEELPHFEKLNTKYTAQAYEGCIMDLNKTYAPKGFAVIAIDALLANKPVEIPSAKAIGCGIKWKM